MKSLATFLLPGVVQGQVEKSMKECVNSNPLVFTEHSCCKTSGPLDINRMAKYIPGQVGLKFVFKVFLAGKSPQHC